MEQFQKALITGASSGIGEALARFFATQGIDLIITARRTEQLNSLADELKESVSVQVVTADLSNPEDRQKVVSVIHNNCPDLVVNNAGYGFYGDALTYETSEMLDMVEVDVTALVELTLEAARTMVTNKRKGVVMNISSVAAFQVFPAFSVYAASKAFVNTFSESLNYEVSPYGVNILTNCPGMVDTEFRFRAAKGRKSEAHPQSMDVNFAVGEIWQQILKRKPLHLFDWRYRLGTFISQYVLPKSWVVKLIQNSIGKRSSNREIIKVKSID